MVPRSVALASPGNVFEMHVLRPPQRPTESETVMVGPSDLRFNKNTGDSDAH